MLLFGIPHKGLVVDDIQQMLSGQDIHPRSTLLDQISSKSDLLAYQLNDFKNLIRDRKVVSFYETGQTRRLEFVCGYSIIMPSSEVDTLMAGYPEETLEKNRQSRHDGGH